MDKEKTGELIRNARLEKKLTQEKLGDIIGVTNKAVSRWENGESFPDVDLLDRLSSALDLKIEELVVGERRKTVGEKELDAIIKEIRLQRAQRKRRYLFCGIGSAFTGVLVLLAYLSFTGKAGSWPLLTWAVLLGLCVTTATVLNLKLRGNKKSKPIKVLSCISIITGLYCVTLVLLTVTSATNGVTPFKMSISVVGPFLRYQLITICLINILLTAFSFFKLISEAKNAASLAIVSETVAILSMAYGCILSGLSEVALRQVEVLITQTVATLIIMLFGLLISRTADSRRLRQSNTI